MSSPRFAALFIVTVASAACAGVQPATSSSIQQRSARSITGEQILASGGYTALDGVRLLRGGALTLRTPTTLQNGTKPPLIAYLDGTKLRSLETLSSVHVQSVASIDYLDGPTATIRYGLGHTGGALVVTTHR